MSPRVLATLMGGLVFAALPREAAAASTLRPRVIVMVDTSGSMTDDFLGNATGADGSSSFSDSVIGTRTTLYSGLQSTNSCTASGPYLGANSRLFAAKAALSQTINGFADLDWGLMRYSGTQCAIVATTTQATLYKVPDACSSNTNCASASCDTGSGVCRCQTSSQCKSGICSSGECAPPACSSDNDCERDAFCVSGSCVFDDNLCAVNAYAQTDHRSPNGGGVCGAHADLPITFLGDCGSDTASTDATCTTIQTCSTDADCGLGSPIAVDGGGRAGQCTFLGAGLVKACGCTSDADCPISGATSMFHCAFASGSSGPKVCKYAQPCVSGGFASGGQVGGGGGVILVEPGAANASQSALDYCDGIETLSGGGDVNPELRATGSTPLAGSARSAAVWYAGAGAPADSAARCRPYVLVQITDGADTCENGGTGTANPPYTDYGPVAAAQGFVAATVSGAHAPNKVYVVGLSANAALKTELNAIARAGGTGAAYLANNVTDLEQALAEISAAVEASAPVEKCNYVDDDCDGVADEPFPDLGQTCGNGAVGHCAASGVFKCSSDQLGESCAPAACKVGQGTALTRSGSTMTLTGMAARGYAVGQPIQIVAALHAENLGTFTISAVAPAGCTANGNCTSVSWTNATGLAETASAAIGFEYQCQPQTSCRQGTGVPLSVSGASATLSGVSGFSAADVGGSITISGASQAANQGTFAISAVGPSGCTNDCTSVTYANENAVDDTVSYSIDCRDPMCRRGSGASLSGKSGGTINLTGVSGFTAADLGATVTISSATNPGNVGSFAITAVDPSSQAVTLANPNGVDEAAGASGVGWNVYCANAESLGGCNGTDDDCNGVVDDCTEGVAGSCCCPTCTALDACHDVGTCDSMAGRCTNPQKADGSPCPGGTCEAGVCTASSVAGSSGSSGSSDSGSTASASASSTGSSSAGATTGGSTASSSTAGSTSTSSTASSSTGAGSTSSGSTTSSSTAAGSTSTGSTASSSTAAGSTSSGTTASGGPTGSATAGGSTGSTGGTVNPGGCGCTSGGFDLCWLGLGALLLRRRRRLGATAG